MATLWSEALYMSRKVLCSFSMSGFCSPPAALATASGMLSVILVESTGTVGVILRCRKALTLRLPPIRYPCSKVYYQLVWLRWLAFFTEFFGHPSLRDWTGAGKVEIKLSSSAVKLEMRKSMSIGSQLRFASACLSGKS